MAIEVFNRYEKKFIITDDIYQQLKPQLEEYMEVDEHSRNGDFYTICNIYYDTPDNEIIRKSIEKPIYKEKLRLRCYGVVGPKDKVYLELKKKFNGCVNKRRTSITLEDAYRYLDTRQKPMAKNQLNYQILNEIDFFINRYPTLKPAVYLSYDRNAMFGIDDRNFRITFDTNIRSRRENVGLDTGNYGELLLPDGVWVMEVKMKEAAPLWFAELLSRYKVYPTTFSKYGNEYQKTMLHSRTICEYNKIYA
ncbi:MAG TPA: polyphosphate polymerase domain-containing protein [Mobilitalea sp.]|nr:polyphosphate polymerase domain-containing protein [Mobilitalea sp.]